MSKAWIIWIFGTLVLIIGVILRTTHLLYGIGITYELTRPFAVTFFGCFVLGFFWLDEKEKDNNV